MVLYPRASNPHNCFRIWRNQRNLCMPQSRGFERPRRSRSQHWDPGGARCLSSASVAQMLAVASTKVMDALFGLVAQNDAEWYILGESFWDAHGVEIGACANFTDFPGIRDNFPDPRKNAGSENKSRIGCTGRLTTRKNSTMRRTRPSPGPVPRPDRLRENGVPAFGGTGRE